LLLLLLLLLLLVISSVLDAQTLYVGCAMRTLPTNDSRHFFGLSPMVIGQLPTANCFPVNSQQSTVNSQQSTVNSQQSTVNSQQSTVNSQQITEPFELDLLARLSVQEQSQQGAGVLGLAALREPHQTEFSPARS
jgi:beta-lactamase regulating signal transducer with metallopeptidase domain